MWKNLNYYFLSCTLVIIFKADPRIKKIHLYLSMKQAIRTFWLGLGCMNKANCPHVESGPMKGNDLRGGLSKAS